MPFQRESFLYRRQHLHTAAPREFHRERLWCWEPEEKAGLQVQKVTAGPVVLGQLHHRDSLPRVRDRHRRTKQTRLGTAAGTMSSVWRAGTEAFPVSTHSPSFVAGWPIPVGVVLRDCCTAEMNLIHSQGKTGLENRFTRFILYFLVICLLNMHCFGGGGLFFEVFFSF